MLLLVARRSHEICGQEVAIDSATPLDEAGASAGGNSMLVPGISSGLQIHDKKGIESMRASGRLAVRVREYAGTLVKPGVTTDEIDEAFHNMIIENGAYPSPHGYGWFP